MLFFFFFFTLSSLLPKGIRTGPVELEPDCVCVHVCVCVCVCGCVHVCGANVVLAVLHCRDLYT